MDIRIQKTKTKLQHEPERKQGELITINLSSLYDKVFIFFSERDIYASNTSRTSIVYKENSNYLLYIIIIWINREFLNMPMLNSAFYRISQHVQRTFVEIYNRYHILPMRFNTINAFNERNKEVVCPIESCNF